MRVSLACVACALLLLNGVATAQPAPSNPDVKARVLDVLFPHDVEAPYFLKIVLRFGDSNTQTMIVVYRSPQRRAELIQSRLADLTPADFDGLIANAVAENARVTPAEIAGKVK